jgi:cytochrome c oxidase assembly factor CtaG
VPFVTGVLVAAWCLCGGLGSYSAALFSADVARLLTMGLVVPALVTGGAPVLLARGPGTDPPRVGRFLDPVNGLVLLVLLLAGVLMTPLLEVSLRTPVLHTALPVAVLAAGILFLGPLLAVDLPWRQRGGTADGPLLVSVLAVLLLVYAGHIRTSVTLFADSWFSRLGFWWGDPAADQRLAAWWVAGFGLALLVAARLLARRGRTTAARPAVGPEAPPTGGAGPVSPVRDRT